mmetsp:Transcript_108116/g.232973  ORF Transcript_108116/g.232973 Transcript_108116/m.232973 type:complete len:305 (-) Transcript_108116:43-957(-)
MPHGANDLGGIVRGRALQVDVAGLHARPRAEVLGPDDQHAQHLAMGLAAFPHVLDDIDVVVVSGPGVHLQELVDPDDRARRVAPCRQHCGARREVDIGYLALWLLRHTGVVRPLDGNRDAEHQHAVEVQRPLRLLDGGDLAEAVVGSLFAREPDVEDRVLVRVVAEAPVPHRLVELLREHVLGDPEVVRQVANPEAPALPRVVEGRAGVGARHPLEAVPEHALAGGRNPGRRGRVRLPALGHELLLLLPAAHLTVAAPLGGVRRDATLLLDLLVLGLSVPIAVCHHDGFARGRAGGTAGRLPKP